MSGKGAAPIGFAEILGDSVTLMEAAPHCRGRIIRDVMMHDVGDGWDVVVALEKSGSAPTDYLFSQRDGQVVCGPVADGAAHGGD